MRRIILALPVFLACLCTGGCIHTRDVSDSPECQPWIGKTVNLRTEPSKVTYNVFDPPFERRFISSIDNYRGYPIITRLPAGYPVVVKAVERTWGTSFMYGGIKVKNDLFLLSIEEPYKPGERFTAWCDLHYVEQFQGKHNLTEVSNSGP